MQPRRVAGRRGSAGPFLSERVRRALAPIREHSMQTHVLRARYGPRHVQGQRRVEDPGARRHLALDVEGQEGAANLARGRRAREDVISRSVAEGSRRALVERVVLDRQEGAGLHRREPRLLSRGSPSNRQHAHGEAPGAEVSHRGLSLPRVGGADLSVRSAGRMLEACDRMPCSSRSCCCCLFLRRRSSISTPIATTP